MVTFKTTGFAGAQTEMVVFGDRVEAFLARPERGGPPFPGVILCHERYGLVQHTLDLAAKFAQFGYVAIAPDLFSHFEGDKEALNRGEARAAITDNEIRTFLGAGLDYLLADVAVDSARIACMGVCQSGEYPLVLNSVRPELAANVVLYGGAQQLPAMWEVGELRKEPYKDILSRVSAPVLGVWGEADHVVSLDDVLNLRRCLEERRKSYEFTLFRDMPHGWLNDTMPGRYRAREASVAWTLIMDFLGRVFRGDFPGDRVLWKFQSDVSVDYDFSRNVRLA